MANFDKKYGIIIVVIFVVCMIFKPVLCFLILGIFALAYATFYIVFLYKINKNGIETTGTIVSYEADSEGYKSPVVEFLLAAGTIITRKPFLHTSSDLDKFRSYRGNIDKPIKIIYDPENPEKFILKDNYNGCGLIFLIIIGLIFTYISIGNLMGYNNIF